MILLHDLMLLVVCYLLGAIPTGLAVGLRVYGVDLRTVGSKNIGATNAWRQLGWKPGLAVFLVDVGKALAAVLLAGAFAAGGIPEPAILAGVATLLGNFFNVFLGFKGGKGVATSLGVFLGLAPIPVSLAFALFVVVVAITRYISVGSILAALAMPPMVWWFHGTGPLLVMMTVISALVIFKHRTNIARLMAGTEAKIGAKK